MTPASPAAERLYGVMLRLTPAAFRREGLHELLALFRDGYRAARARGRRALLTFWFDTLRDTVRTAFETRVRRSAVRLPSPSFPDRAPMIEILMKDVLYALRALRRTPGFTAVVILTIALGIGANTAIFSVVDGILLRPLPFADPDELVAVWADYTRRDGPLREWLSFPNFLDLRALDQVFDEVGTYTQWGPTLTSTGEPEQLVGANVTAGMFARVLGVQPAIGRTFAADEDVPDGPRVVILSHRAWVRSFAGDPGILGRDITLNGQPYSVIGVMPENLRPPFVPMADVWTTFQLDANNGGGRGEARYLSIGRLADGVDLDAAQAAATTLGSRLEAEFPSANTGVGYALIPLRDDIVASTSTTLWLLLGAVSFVLVMACVNVANLLLSQASSRTAEVAVRAALGATRARITRQLLVESLLMAAFGGGLGALLGYQGTRALVAMAPQGTPRIEEVAVDARVLAFTAVIALGSAVLFGLLPAWRGSRVDLQLALKEGGRGADTGASGRAVRTVLVVAQVALALILLVGAGLLIRTFQQLNAVDLGFETESIVTVPLNLPPSRFTDGASQAGFYAELESRLAALPGVVKVGSINSPPLSGFNTDANFNIEGRPVPPPDQAHVAWIRRVTPGYPEAIGLRLVAGRFFTEADARGAAGVVAINETLAARLFADEDPLGQRVYFGPAEGGLYMTIVGVVGDIRHFGVNQESRQVIYFSYPQVPIGTMTVVLRVTGDPTATTPMVRAAVREIDPLLAVANVATMQEVVSSSLATERFTMTLMAAFALVALVLAVVGLYGVISYGVSQRLHEMGVRMALGAGSNDVGRLIVGGSAALVGAGVVLGVAGAWGLTRLMAGLLFEVAPTDPATFGSVIVVLLAAGLISAMIPAARAARVDPVKVLSQR